MLSATSIELSTPIVRSLAILVADEDAAVRATVRRWLEELGHAVVCAASGNEASRIVRQQHVDVVITEIVMPDGDGLELIRELRSWQPSARIIALSGGGRYLPAADCLHVARGLGAHEVLFKPAQRDLVVGAVDRVISA